MIDLNILLQVDATVIAGVLILLTISVFSGKGILQLKIPFDWNPRSMVAMIIVPFAVSAILIIWSSMNSIPTAAPAEIYFNGLSNTLLAPVASIFGFIYLT